MYASHWAKLERQCDYDGHDEDNCSNRKLECNAIGAVMEDIPCAVTSHLRGQ